MIQPGAETPPAPAARKVSRILDGYYRALSERLRQATGGEDEAPRSIGLTGTDLGGGVTAVALNIAVAEAVDFKRRVLLIDAHSRQPTLSKMFDCGEASGVSDVLTGFATLTEAVHPTGVADGLDILPAGKPYAKSEYADAGSRMDELFRAAELEYDRVYCDLPPVKLGSGCLGWVHRLDGVVLMLEAGQVKAEAARAAKKLLTNAGAKLIGVVLNKDPAPRSDVRRRPR